MPYTTEVDDASRHSVNPALEHRWRMSFLQPGYSFFLVFFHVLEPPDHFVDFFFLDMEKFSKKIVFMYIWAFN